MDTSYGIPICAFILHRLDSIQTSGLPLTGIGEYTQTNNVLVVEEFGIVHIIKKLERELTEEIATEVLEEGETSGEVYQEIWNHENFGEKALNDESTNLEVQTLKGKSKTSKVKQVEECHPTRSSKSSRLRDETTSFERENKSVSASKSLDHTTLKMRLTSILMSQHMSRIYNQDKKGHALVYGFWLGDIFEHLFLPIKSTLEMRFISSMIKGKLVAIYGMGFHPFHQETSQSSWEEGYGNQGQNFKHAGNLGNQEREESIYSNIGITLEKVLERVTSTDLGVWELKGYLLALTQTVESYNISIRNLEERMNQLVSQIESGVNVYARGPLVEMIATNPEDDKCCGDRILRNSKPPHVRMESVDGEDID
ncbi:hypothetical protein HAX54_000586 [Datura stramonium]|uniref:Uncharacterized protein n=1 Tax=Datura stramonium TaxID=4076 RepID=A0ABS8T1W7_DATST|nr:hypothetical protein [Datura stramonium]